MITCEKQPTPEPGGRSVDEEGLGQRLVLELRKESIIIRNIAITTICKSKVINLRPIK